MTTKKILSVLICLVMVLSLMPMAAFADDYICGHEQAHINGNHTEDCGYNAGAVCQHQHDSNCADACTHNCAASTEGCVVVYCAHKEHTTSCRGGCTHIHDDECYKTECIHENHTDDCGGSEEGNCTHTCTVDDGCKVLDCKHTHNDDCCWHTCKNKEDCVTAEEAKCNHTHTDACFAKCPHTKGTHEGCGYVAASPCTFVCNDPSCSTPINDTTAPIAITITVTGINDSYEYNNQAVTPEPVVKFNDNGTERTLTKNTDYSVEYSNNNTIGDNASVKITPVSGGKYTFNDYTKGFSIVSTPPVDSATTLTVTLSSVSTTYNGTEQKPVITSVTSGNATLTNSDYTVQYLRGTAEPPDFTSAGTITVRAIGNAGTDYAGKTGSASYTIAKKPLTVTAKDQTIEYGQDIKPAEYEQQGLITSPVHTLSVKLVADTTKKTITPVVTEIKDVNAGNNVMDNYNINPVSGALTITPKSVNTPKIVLERTSYGYTGKEIKPAVTVYDGSTVIPSTEYTVSYTNNVNAGTAYVTVTDNNANGNYAITQTVANFTIASNVKYNVVLGNGGCWYRSSYYGLGFRCDGPFDQFLGITIDGHAVDKSYYVASEGSTNVGLYPQLLSLLGNGTHYITFHYTSGSATGVFYVGSTAINAVMTGDDSNVGLLALVMCLGVLSSVTILGVLRKRKSGA